MQKGKVVKLQTGQLLVSQRGFIYTNRDIPIIKYILELREALHAKRKPSLSVSDVIKLDYIHARELIPHNDKYISTCKRYIPDIFTQLHEDIINTVIGMADIEKAILGLKLLPSIESAEYIPNKLKVNLDNGPLDYRQTCRLNTLTMHVAENYHRNLVEVYALMFE